jgi:hypothetical protein
VLLLLPQMASHGPPDLQKQREAAAAARTRRAKEKGKRDKQRVAQDKRRKKEQAALEKKRQAYAAAAHERELAIVCGMRATELRELLATKKPTVLQPAVTPGDWQLAAAQKGSALHPELLPSFANMLAVAESALSAMFKDLLLLGTQQGRDVLALVSQAVAHDQVLFEQGLCPPERESTQLVAYGARVWHWFGAFLRVAHEFYGSLIGAVERMGGAVGVIDLLQRKWTFGPALNQWFAAMEPVQGQPLTKWLLFAQFEPRLFKGYMACFKFASMPEQWEMPQMVRLESDAAYEKLYYVVGWAFFSVSRAVQRKSYNKNVQQKRTTKTFWIK